MANHFETALIVGASLIVLSVITSKASSRLGVPSLLLFLGIGLVAGAHGLGGIQFTDYILSQEVGTVALVFILFSGGLGTDAKKVRTVIGPALVLSTVGVGITTALVALFSEWFRKYSPTEGLLLGATIASTDVAAVFTVLRSKNVSLKTGISPLLELESALNDPMAVFLGVALLNLSVGKSHSFSEFIPLFFEQMILGALFGWAFGNCGVILINRIKLEYEGLYPVLCMGWILFVYALTQLLGGSGFLAVYIAGVILGNASLLHKKSLLHFNEGIAWLGQIGMFLAMGLLVNPAELWVIAPFAISLSLFLVFIARPVSVLLSLPFSRFTFKEKMMVSWGGLRGAVPIILASYVLASQIPKAVDIFNLVFFVTFFSVLIQGTMMPIVAKLLKVNLPFKEKFRFPIELNPTKNLKNDLIEVPVSQDSPTIGKSLLQLRLPKNILIVLIERNGDVIVPRGGTHLQKDDILLVLSQTDTVDTLKTLFG